MREIATKVYQFDELSDDVKERARQWWREGGLDYEWWDFIYEDAERIGLKLTEFDLDRNRHACGDFIKDATEVAELVINEHGDECETYKDAVAFLDERDKIVDWAERDENGEFVDEYGLDELLDECENEFLRTLLEDYSIILQHEMEYLLSDEQVDETIRANEYEFTEDGNRV